MTVLDVPSGIPAHVDTPAPGDPRLARLSLNQRTTANWNLREAVDGAAAAGLPAIGLWREPVAEVGVDAARRIVDAAGLRVSSLCRGGFFTDPDTRARRDDNRRAVDEAAALATDVLILVSGGLPDQQTGVADARNQVADAIAELVPYARQHGVRLAVEALHPMFCSDRCVISTLDQATDIALAHPPDAVGVVVDAYHLWWDPNLDDAIARAGDRIVSFQVCDWVTPLPEGVLTGRGVMGDGCIPLRAMRRAVEKVGYTGPIEVEIFNDELWSRPGAEALDLIIERYRTHVI